MHISIGVDGWRCGTVFDRIQLASQSRDDLQQALVGSDLQNRCIAVVGSQEVQRGLVQHAGLQACKHIADRGVHADGGIHTGQGQNPIATHGGAAAEDNFRLGGGRAHLVGGVLTIGSVGIKGGRRVVGPGQCRRYVDGHRARHARLAGQQHTVGVGNRIV